MKIVTRALALGFALASIAGCGGAGRLGPASGPSCSGTNSNGVPFCIEVVSGTVDPTQVQDVCAQVNATVATTPCNRTGSVGGCAQSSQGVTLATWFYAPASMSTVQQDCQQNNSQFVLP